MTCLFILLTLRNGPEQVIVRTKITIVVIAAMLLTGTGVIAASSFTTATLTRDTNIDVVSDADGVIALTDGNSGSIVTVDGTTGELQIDFAVGSATGVNVDSRYELGDPDDPSQRAFNITNQDSVSHDITLNYTVSDGTSGVGDGESSVQFLVFDASGTQVASEDEESGDATFTAASGETFAVVVVVDTTMAGVDQSSDLSGTLNVTAAG